MKDATLPSLLAQAAITASLDFQAVALWSCSEYEEGLISVTLLCTFMIIVKVTYIKGV